MRYEREPPDARKVEGRLRLIRLEYVEPGANRSGGGLKPLSQGRFAERIPLGRERLASYEAGSVPLNFNIGWEICRLANRSQLWLATGESPRIPFLNADVGAAKTKITDRTPFLQGITALWDSLIQASVACGISVTQLPAARPDFSADRRVPPTEPGELVKGRIRVTSTNRSAGQLAVIPEFMPGCTPANAPPSILLTHPGVASVLVFMKQRKRPRGAALSLLLGSLPLELREDEFLRRLEPTFLLELELAVQKLVGARPPDKDDL